MPSHHSAANLGARIRALRESLALTQTALATAVGAGRASTVSHWEQNRATPDRGTLRLLGDLTDNSDAVSRWLQEGGTMPTFAARATSSPAPTHAPRTPTMPLALLPPPPRVTTREDMQAAYREFVQRVAQLATSGQSVPAHYLLEWAALLLRTAEAYDALDRQLEIVRASMPLMLFELDTNLRIVRYWSRERKGSRPRALEDRQLVDVLKQLDSGRLDTAVRAARGGESGVVEFSDQSRSYRARLDAVGDHFLLAVDRANENREHELGL